MVMQKKFYIIVLLLSVVGASGAMDKEQSSGDHHHTNTAPLLNSDNFFTADEKKRLDLHQQSVLYTQYQIMRLIKQMEQENKVMHNSGRHYRPITSVGPITPIEHIDNNKNKSTETLSGEYGKQVEYIIPAKL